LRWVPAPPGGRPGGGPHLPELATARVEAIDDRPFPVQVDGDYLGEYSEVEFGVTPGGLLAVS
jgi:diacylglycerol kinase family enzyme